MHRIEGCFLVTDQGTIPFSSPIAEAIEIRGVTVVRLELYNTAMDIRNVYGIANGQILWQIQELTDYNPLLIDPLLSQWEPYTGIEVYDKNSALLLGTSCGGFRYLIDPMSGKIVGEESWVK